MKRAFLWTLTIYFFAAAAFAERIDTTEKKPKFGIFGGYSANFHVSNFAKLPGISSCCKKDMGGFGGRFSVGGLAEYPFYEKWRGQLRVSYNSFGGELTQRENADVLVYDEETKDYEIRDGIFEYRLSPVLGALSIEPLAVYKIMDNFFAYGGFKFSYLIIKDYEYFEEIVEPKNHGYFIGTNRSKTRAEQSGELQSTNNLGFSLTAGSSYQLRANPDSSFFICPEIFYSFLISPVVENSGWNVHSIRLGASVKYREPPPPPPPPEPPANAPLPEYPKVSEPPEIHASVKTVQIDSAGYQKSELKVKVEDFISHYMSPLLTYVFFEENSFKIPERYNLLTAEEAKNFSLTTLRKKGTIETYRHILNIIGYRLKQQPDAGITLIGTNCYSGEEKRNLELSKNRARSVKDYLTYVWKIDSERIKVKYRHLPKQPSNIKEPEGQEENRRVEIHSDSWDIIEPVIVDDTTRSITKTKIIFYPKAKAEAGLAKWKLTLFDDQKTLKTFEGEGSPPDSIALRIDSTSSYVADASKLKYRFTAEDSLSNKFQTPSKSFSVERLTVEKKRVKKVLDREYEYYSLILFDYGKYRLRNQHRKVLKFIQDRLRENSRIIIRGYTDKLGDEKLNRRISKSRAKAVARYLGIRDAKILGLGESSLIYDNSTPEGRFYCRTVKITIETPIQNK